MDPDDDGKVLTANGGESSWEEPAAGGGSGIVITQIDYAHPATDWSDETGFITYQVATAGVYSVLQTGNAPYLEFDTAAGILSAAGAFGATPADIESNHGNPSDGNTAQLLSPSAALSVGDCMTFRKPDSAGAGNAYALAAYILGPAAAVFVEDPTDLPVT